MRRLAMLALFAAIPAFAFDVPPVQIWHPIKPRTVIAATVLTKELSKGEDILTFYLVDSRGDVFTQELQMGSGYSAMDGGLGIGKGKWRGVQRIGNVWTSRGVRDFMLKWPSNADVDTTAASD